MDIILKIVTFGLYGLFAKKRKLSQTVEKIKYNDDGTIRKSIKRDTDYDSEEAPSLDVE